MAKKAAKALVKFLESNGFAYARTNSKNFEFYSHPRCGELFVNPEMNESAAKNVERNVRRQLGLLTDKDESKRHVGQIKARQESERERLKAERDRHQAELDEYERQMSERLSSLTNAEWNAVCREIERREREIREFDRLMRETPDTGHRGVEHAKHRS